MDGARSVRYNPRVAVLASANERFHREVFAPLVRALVFKTSVGFGKSSKWVRFPYTSAYGAANRNVGMLGWPTNLARGWPTNLARGWPTNLARGWPTNLARGWPTNLARGWPTNLAKTDPPPRLARLARSVSAWGGCRVRDQTMTAVNCPSISPNAVIPILVT